jgi:DUF1365 family protein
VVNAVPALYEATVTHQRRAPLTNRFRYRAWYWLVDLDDLPQPSRLLRLFARVDGRDHMDVRALLREAGIPAERVLMLTGARSLGYVFNPISVFWAYDCDGTRTAVVAEVHNTYGDRHAYLLEGDGSAGGFAPVDKEMYVSPFYPVDGQYRIHVGDPGEWMTMTVELHREGDEPFVATMRGRRQALTAGAVIRSALRYPAIRTSALIRWQAIRLWCRGLEIQAR